MPLVSFVHSGGSRKTSSSPVQRPDLRTAPWAALIQSSMRKHKGSLKHQSGTGMTLAEHQTNFFITIYSYSKYIYIRICLCSLFEVGTFSLVSGDRHFIYLMSSVHLHARIEAPASRFMEAARRKTVGASLASNAVFISKTRSYQLKDWPVCRTCFKHQSCRAGLGSLVFSSFM